MKKTFLLLLSMCLLSCSLEKRPDTAWGEDDWKSPVCVTPEAQVPLTLESKFRMTPIKS